jgi:hypothetical protein
VGVLATSVSNIVWAGSEGRRNTAIGATALAVGAWANGTGHAGRRNTALLATGGAAYAWSKYADKKKEEKRGKKVVYLSKGRPVRRQVVYVPANGHGKWKKAPRGHAWGHWKKHGKGHRHHGDG